MAEIVASAVVSDTVSRISTFLIGKCCDRKPSEKDDDDGTERLEMAHIRMEAALETSGKSWPPLTDVSLLRWRVKLKRAADECDAVLRGRKRRAMEQSSSQETERRRSFPARIAHAARSLFSSSIEDSSGAEIRRYERFADEASEFLRFVELGGRVGRRMLLDPLVGHILAGRAFQYQILQGGRRYYLASRPMGFAERGLEARVMLRYQERGAPAKDFVLGIFLRVTESTDLVGTVSQCLESLTLPLLKPVADIAKQELDRVHTRSLHCFPFLASTDPVYWNIHSSETRLARANPLCCHGGHEPHRSGMRGMMKFPEPAIKISVRRHVSGRRIGRRRKRKRTSPSVAVDLVHGGGIGSEDSRPLQLTAVFAPHASLEELPSGVESIGVEVIDGGRRPVRENVGLHELEELLLPNAISRLCHGTAEGSAQEVFWRSGHGIAYLCVEKTGTDMAVHRPTLWQI